MGAELRFLLLESSIGYVLVERKKGDEVAAKSPEFQAAVTDFAKFAQLVSLKGFVPFRTAEEALENINHVSEGLMTPLLQGFLEQNLPAAQAGKKAKFALGVTDKLGAAIQEGLGVPCMCNEQTTEMLRGVCLHCSGLISALRPGDVERAQLGLAHSYSRSKVKFDVNRADKHIIQSIAILDTLDKDINTFAMRVREWYSWHFPELIKIVGDNYLYARLVMLIQRRSSLTAERLGEVEAVTMDAAKAQAVLDAAKHSMGMDISEIDLINIHAFAERVIKLAEYRKSLQEYLHSKMGVVAPNLQSLIGDAVAARLISHAGSHQPRQVSGVDRADPRREGAFRALKTRGNTPKYGLILIDSSAAPPRRTRGGSRGTSR